MRILGEWKTRYNVCKSDKKSRDWFRHTWGKYFFHTVPGYNCLVFKAANMMLSGPFYAFLVTISAILPTIFGAVDNDPNKFSKANLDSAFVNGTLQEYLGILDFNDEHLRAMLFDEIEKGNGRRLVAIIGTQKFNPTFLQALQDDITNFGLEMPSLAHIALNTLLTGELRHYAAELDTGAWSHSAWNKLLKKFGPLGMESVSLPWVNYILECVALFDHTSLLRHQANNTGFLLGYYFWMQEKNRSVLGEALEIITPALQSQTYDAPSPTAPHLIATHVYQGQNDDEMQDIKAMDDPDVDEFFFYPMLDAFAYAMIQPSDSPVLTSTTIFASAEEFFSTIASVPKARGMALWVDQTTNQAHIRRYGDASTKASPTGVIDVFKQSNANDEPIHFEEIQPVINGDEEDAKITLESGSFALFYPSAVLARYDFTADLRASLLFNFSCSAPDEPLREYLSSSIEQSLPMYYMNTVIVAHFH